MQQRFRSVFQGWLLLGAFALIGTQGCVLDGDASLGKDDTDSDAGGEPGRGGEPPSGEDPGAPHGGTSGVGSTAGTAGSSTPSAAGQPSSAGGTSEPGAAGAPTGAGGEPSGTSPDCELAIDVGFCDAAIPRYAYDNGAGKCVPFTYGGCDGNANNFATLEACQVECEKVKCAANRQTDTVYFVQPLNRPERACIVSDQPVHVSCSPALDPAQSVPSNWPSTHCVSHNGETFYAVTTLPKADGWTDCSTFEADLVDQAPKCSEL